MDTPTFTSNVQFEGNSTETEKAIASLMSDAAEFLGANPLASVHMSVLTNVDVHATAYIPRLLGIPGQSKGLDPYDWDLMGLLSFIGKPVLVYREHDGNIAAIYHWPTR